MRQLFFNEVLFVQIAIIASIALLVVNTSVYSVLLLGSFYLVSIVFALSMSGFTVAAVLLIVAEAHVLHMAMCLALGWLKFDTLTAGSLLSSKSLNNNAAAVAIAAVFLLSTKFGFSLHAGVYASDFYVYALMLDAENFYYESSLWARSSVLVATCAAYSTSLSTEFCIINCYMCIAAVLYMKFYKAVNSATVQDSVKTVLKALGLLKKVSSAIREQEQTSQLGASTGVRALSRASDNCAKRSGL